MRIFLICLLTVAIVAGLYVRFAPSDPARWHALPEDMDNRDEMGGALRVVEAEEGDLTRLHAIALATPRTHVLSGSLEEGMITYVTRTRVIGFPDYTTIRQVGTRIDIHARLRFGASDMGVNAARLDAWLAALSGS